MGEKYFRHSLLFAFIAVSALVFKSCADGDYATVRINLNLPGAEETAYKPSLLDRAIAFLTMSRPLEAAPAPGMYNISSIKVEITGPGMDDITAEIDPDIGAVDLAVPAGQDRKI